jgi:uncharacterized membrane protein
VAGVTALDLLCSGRLSRRGALGIAPARHAVAVRRTITINRPPDELYRYWRDFRNLPRFMPRIRSVEVSGARRSHWTATGPGGLEFEWDAEVVDDRPGERIAWESLPGARVAHAGIVRFQRAPGGRGTEVTVEIEYSPPGGVAGAAVAQLTGRAPGQQLEEDLRRFKQLMETGEIPVAEGRRGAARPAEPAPAAAMGGRR